MAASKRRDMQAGSQARMMSSRARQAAQLLRTNLAGWMCGVERSRTRPVLLPHLPKQAPARSTACPSATSLPSLCCIPLSSYTHRDLPSPAQAYRKIRLARVRSTIPSSKDPLSPTKSTRVIIAADTTAGEKKCPSTPGAYHTRPTDNTFSCAPHRTFTTPPK